MSTITIMQIIAKKIIANSIPSKSCTECELVWPITPAYFQTCKRYSSGYDPVCRYCRQEASREYKKSNKTSIAAKDKKYNSMPEVQEARRIRQRNDIRKSWAKQYRQLRPEPYYYSPKNTIRMQTWRAVKGGTLIKQPCSVCGKVDKIEAHHEDYTKPLKIVWLCKLHHAELHRLQSQIKHGG